MAYIKINKKNLYHNLNQIALKAGSIDKVAVVLKDNAYGHGIEIVAQLSSEFGIKQAVVVSPTEAMQVRDYFDHVLVLNGTPFADNKISFAITNIRSLRDIASGSKIELKVDTGMHRNGISMDEMKEALSLIKKRGIDLIGVMTHFKSADELGSELYWQKKNFDNVKQMVMEAGFKNIRFHSHNSAAILRAKHFSEDIVRAGIAIYGYNELPDSYDKIELKPVLSLYAKCRSTRKLKEGQRVGYGGDFMADKDMIVSTYDLGYGDGWLRGDSDSPYVTVEELPILGRVSMDFISLESEKDEICVMDDAKKAAKHFGTISYEMTTMLSKDIDRVVITANQ